MKQATFAIACLILWSLQTVTCEAQDETADAKKPPEIEEAAKAVPSESDPPEAAANEALSEAAAELPAAVAEASEAILQRIARLQAEKTGPTIDDMCEVKHYGEGNLHGFGLVLDLEAVVASQTGEEDEEGVQPPVDLGKLVQTLNQLNQSVAEEDGQKSIIAQLDGADELTVVSVTAETPPEGLRQGERIDCEVESVEGTSLDNGHLLPTLLSTLGPAKEANAALASGPLGDGRTTGSQTVVGGCLLKTDICDQFTQNNKITLVLDEDHAEFAIAQEVVDLINLEMGVGTPALAKALNRYSIEVSIPAEYEENPVAFVTRILRLPAPEALAEELEE